MTANYIRVEDYPYCNNDSDIRRRKIYAKMLAKVQSDEFGHHYSLRSYLVSQFVTFEQTWETIGNRLDVSAGTIQRATEALKIWRKKIRHKQEKPRF
jgi:hypothetical protein